ncbi:MAG: hypothetical protein AAF630_15920 [Cyanobacteria bacterium P01_C01_bin.38]
MSLLREIQEATTNPNYRLADVLRLSKILAARLSHQELRNWVEKELNGYKSSDVIPRYRILKNLGSRGDFIGLFGRGAFIAPIPLFCLPEEFAASLSKVNVLQSVSAIENIVEQANNSGTSILREFWPADAVALFGSDIFEDMKCGQAWRDIPTNSFVAILDTVKNSILNFVLEIEIQAPYAGEAEPGTKPIPDAVVTQIFYQFILDQSTHKSIDKSKKITNLQQELIMSDNHSTNIQAGRDASGNISNSEISGVVASGDISGIVNNSISQLQKSDDHNIIKLAELLNKLKTAIETEPALPAEDKEVALEQVAVLASEGQNPKKESKFKPVKTAIAALKGTVAGLPAAAKLVKEFNQLLPLIGQFFNNG